MRRGSSAEAAALVRTILATRDDRPHTAHDITANADREQLPERVCSLLIDRRVQALHARRTAYRRWQDGTYELLVERQRWIDRHLSRGRDRSLYYGIEL